MLNAICGSFNRTWKVKFNVYISELTLDILKAGSTSSFWQSKSGYSVAWAAPTRHNARNAYNIFLLSIITNWTSLPVKLWYVVARLVAVAFIRCQSVIYEFIFLPLDLNLKNIIQGGTLVISDSQPLRHYFYAQWFWEKIVNLFSISFRKRYLSVFFIS